MPVTRIERIQAMEALLNETGDAVEALKPNMYAVVATGRTLSVVRSNGTAILIR